MGLRDKNPLIDSDLELIVTTFEKAMIKSRDSDSVLVPFRRHLNVMEALPTSIKKSINDVPNPASGVEQSNTAMASAPDSIITPEGAASADSESKEDSEDDAEWKEKVKELLEDCIPCDFRSLTSLDAEFFSGIADKWESAIDKAGESLDSLEGILDGYKDKFTGLVDQADELVDDIKAIGEGTTEDGKTISGDIVSPLQNICEIGNSLKGQCIPDIKKMIFMMEMFLTDMENQFSLDLGIADSFLTSLLSPLFNEMVGNLDIIDELALGPIRCVLNNIEQQIMRGGEVAAQGFESATNVAESRNIVGRVATRRSQEDSNSIFNSQANQTPARSTRMTRAEELAERAQAEQSALRQRAERQAQRGSERINSAFDRMREATTFLDRFKRCLQTAFDYLEDKKDWLINLLEELVSTGDEQFSNNLSFAQNKKDLLENIAIMKALVDAAKAGGFSCGPETDSMTESELEVFFTMYQHPSESLDISVINGNIVVRRNPDGQSGSDGNTVTTGASSSGASGLGNIVVQRPISSCLKKVTAEEADQVQQWIAQLEQEG